MMMVNITENNMNSAVDDPEESQWHRRKSASISINRNVVADICQSPSIFIFLIIIAIIPSKFVSFEKLSMQCHIKLNE